MCAHYLTKLSVYDNIEVSLRFEEKFAFVLVGTTKKWPIQSLIEKREEKIA